MPSSRKSDSPPRSPRSRSSQDPLRAGDKASHTAIAPAGCPHGARKGLEEGFDLVMIGAAVQDSRVHVSSCAARESFKEGVDEFCLQISDQSYAHLGIHHD